MRKFTTFILVLTTLMSFQSHAQSQNIDWQGLKTVNSIRSTIGFSTLVSNKYFNTGVNLSVPLAIGIAGIINKDDETVKNALYIGASIAVDGVLTVGLKQTFNRPRPYTNNELQLIDPEKPSDPSFPSGHTSFAFATATAVSLKYPKWYVIAPAYTWAGIVGYSRMNLGAHYPSDVLAGALLGAGSAWVTYKANNWFWKKIGNKKLIALESYR